MKVPIVVDTPQGSKTVGWVDVYASSWLDMPKDMKMELDGAILMGRAELKLNIKEIVI